MVTGPRQPAHGIRVPEIGRQSCWAMNRHYCFSQRLLANQPTRPLTSRSSSLELLPKAWQIPANAAPLQARTGRPEAVR